ncbi:GntR family transcriptional regulator [Bacilliculturomica massiliensis]|uniref:GntR family transcriptional regulator n=1 Tax=Bacilliculturomica massiliensis TaxID=1917867 RepID=UPI002ED04784
MGYDIMMYERVFQILKNKIECGLLPEGSSLPSRIKLCQEFGTSEKTIRHALKLLEEAGFIETRQGKRPVVSPGRNAVHRTTVLALEKIDAEITDDVLKTGVLLCYPIIKNGISLCRKKDLLIPKKILDNMDISNAGEFWRLSKQFWRFFVARNENDLSLRAVDSLGLKDLKPLKDDVESRGRYFAQLQGFMKIIESGGAPESAAFDDMSGLYGFTYGNSPAFHVPADSAVILGRKQLEKLLTGAEVRYASVYMDLLGLIAVGRYQRGDKLPAHKELQEIYGVCVDTTIKAIQIMQEWGVVKTVRGNGIFVEVDLKELKKIEIPAHLIANQVRRYLDSLELLALTIEGTAACAAPHIGQEEIRAVKNKIDRLWNEEYLYGRTPALLLDVIIEHMGMDALHAIYTLLKRNLRIGRSIPALLDTKKTAVNCHIHEQGVRAIELLSAGNYEAFSEKTARLFESIYSSVVKECKRLGYYEAAMATYDGSALWK